MASTSPLGIDLERYKWGFHDSQDKYVFKARKGLDADVVNQISHMKGEPDWMRAFRLHAYEHFTRRPMPTWGADLGQIDFNDIYYYLKPTEGKGRTWEEVPAEIKRTFDRLGIPEAEKKYLAGVGAQYECLSADTRVYTARGLVPISEVRSGDSVFAFDEASERLIPARVTARDFKGEREVFQVRVGNCTIKATSNHPFLVLEYRRKAGKQRGRYRRTWKYLHELKVGDLVAVAKKLPDTGQPYDLREVAPISRRHTPISLPRQSSADLMWWLGLYVGDGFIHRDGAKARVEFAIPESDDGLRRELGRVTQALFGIPARNGDRYRMTVYSSVLANYLEANGFAGRARTKEVPAWVSALPQEQILAFLGGYVDADGYVRDAAKNHDVVLTSSNEPLLQSVKGLAALCGLPTSSVFRFESRDPKGTDRRIVGYRMQFAGHFERLGCRSRQRTERFGKRRHYHDYSGAGGTTFRVHTNEFVGFRKIESIILAGTAPVYDIEVDGPHNFVAEGLIVHNSESVYHNLKEEWEKLGVIFLDTDSALKQYPDLVREYLGTVVPPEDNKLAALNSAVWSGGSFVYVPAGVHVDIPLQAYFRINAEKAGQFERTMIICEPGSYVHYVEGCTAPIYVTDSLHSAVVEIIVKEGARCRYTTIQNWSTNTYNLVTKRAVAYRDATMEWIDGNIGCLTGDSKVLLNNDVRPISDVEAGDTVYSVDGELNLTRHKVVAKKYSGKQRVFRLRGENYREIRATANHPFLTLSKRGKHVALGWKHLDQLKIGDFVAIAGDVPDSGVPKNLDPVPPRGRKRITVPSVSTEELLWVLGVYTGDGYLDRARVYFAVPPQDKSHSKLVELLHALFGVDVDVYGNTVRVNSVHLRDFIAAVGFTGNASQKRIPAWVYRLPKAQRLAFIEGYISADGYRRPNHTNLSITSVNRKLLEDIKALAISCGLDPRKISRWSRVEKKPLGKETKEYVHYFLYFGERAYEQPVHFTKVASIEPEGVEDTWDLEIAGSHNFVANGFIVHNSKITMKYPSVYMVEPGAKAEILSVAYAGKGQHQDPGGKVIHAAPHTQSSIVSKSIAKDGGRAGYRGLVKVYSGSEGSKCAVRCDALILDEHSRSDTYPYMEIDEEDVQITHEATVSKISDEQLFYLMARGIKADEAMGMIVRGFIEPITKELPLEYAVELNRLIAMEMEGSVG